MSEQIENKSIKRSENFIQVVGTLLEKNYKIEEKTVELDPNGKKVKVTCQVIEKAEFKNPFLLIECDIKDEYGKDRYIANVGIDSFSTYEKKLDENGNVIDNPNFKSIMTMINNYVAKKDAKEDENPTRVKVDGNLVPNEYPTKDGEWKNYGSKIMLFQCTSTGVPENDICEGKLTGIIRTVVPETRKDGEDLVETGRLKVEFYSFDSKEKTSPTTLIVEQDLAEDFKEMYDNGKCGRIYYEVITKIVGASKINNNSFGRRKSNMVSGFEVTEYSVFNWEEPFEEENDLFVPIALMKTAMKEREVMIETRIKQAKEKADTPKSKPTGETKSKGLGNRSSKMTDVPVQSGDDMPF